MNRSRSEADNEEEDENVEIPSNTAPKNGFDEISLRRLRRALMLGVRRMRL